jgi:hypothetical protein
MPDMVGPRNKKETIFLSDLYFWLADFLEDCDGLARIYTRLVYDLENRDHGKNEPR